MTAMDSRPLFPKVIKFFLILRFLFLIRTLGSRRSVSVRGVARIFQKGGHRGYSPDCHVDLHAHIN